MHYGVGVMIGAMVGALPKVGVEITGIGVDVTVIVGVAGVIITIVDIEVNEGIGVTDPVLRIVDEGSGVSLVGVEDKEVGVS